MRKLRLSAVRQVDIERLCDSCAALGHPQLCDRRVRVRMNKNNMPVKQVKLNGQMVECVCQVPRGTGIVWEET